MELSNRDIDFNKLKRILLGQSSFKVDKYKKIIFEIRTKEQGHNVPHCHALYEGRSISISLKDFSVLSGNIPLKQKNLASKWVEEHISVLSEYWNKYHKIEV